MRAPYKVENRLPADTIAYCSFTFVLVYLLKPMRAQSEFALSALQALVHVTGGVAANDRDAAVVHILNELLKRSEQLTPALSCSRLGSNAARNQCCQPRKQ